MDVCRCQRPALASTGINPPLSPLNPIRLLVQDNIAPSNTQYHAPVSTSHQNVKRFIMATPIANSRSPRILLDRMLQQPGLLGDDDDWTGSTSFARRKLQNRTNQRAHREFRGGFVLGVRSDSRHREAQARRNKIVQLNSPRVRHCINK